MLFFVANDIQRRTGDENHFIVEHVVADRVSYENQGSSLLATNLAKKIFLSQIEMNLAFISISRSSVAIRHETLQRKCFVSNRHENCSSLFVANSSPVDTKCSYKYFSFQIAIKLRSFLYVHLTQMEMNSCNKICCRF